MGKFNVLEHDLVPKHEILADEDAKKVLQEYGIDAEQLPKIKEEDPVAETIGAKKNQILKITRKSATAGESVYYRLVV